jgi:hypothetical protein
MMGNDFICSLLWQIDWSTHVQKSDKSHSKLSSHRTYNYRRALSCNGIILCH